MSATGLLSGAVSLVLSVSGSAYVDSLIPPAIPGAEYTAPDGRIRFTAPVEKLEYTAPDDRLRFTAPKERLHYTAYDGRTRYTATEE